jgi:hypothetical protein
MKRSTLVLFISIAALTLLLGFGSIQTATAASSQSHNPTHPNSADISPYRWEASAKHYASHQVWPTINLSALNATDASAYRWEAMAGYYISNQVWSDNDLPVVDTADVSASRWQAIANYYESDTFLADTSDFRLVLIQPGFWARQASLPY